MNNANKKKIKKILKCHNLLKRKFKNSQNF